MNRGSSFQPIPVFPIPWQEAEKQRFIRIVTAKAAPLTQEVIWLSPHRKDYYMLQYVTGGSGRHWLDMVPYEFTAGTLYLSSPEQVHVKEEVTLTGTVITFTKEFLAMEQNQGLDKLPIIRNLQKAHELKIGATEKMELESILNNCATEYQQDGYLQTEMLCAHVRVLLIFLSRIYCAQYDEKVPNQRRTLYLKFQACLEDNYTKTHEARDYSHMLNISVSHLNALIKEQSGKTITKHIHERLVLEAKRLLFHTDQTVKQITFSLGFQDTSYFSRFFKKLTAYSPLEYRQQIVP
jgi:AraC family transcriptional activator of pobA